MDLKTILGFAGGLVTGLFVGYAITKRIYSDRNREDLEACENMWKERCGELDDIYEDDDEEQEEVPSNSTFAVKPDIMQYSKMVKEAGYTDYSSYGGTEETAAGEKPEVPYVITPEQFNEFDEEYGTITLDYYSDGVLAEGTDIIDDVENLVGPDAIRNIGLFEPDAIHIRDDERQVDYEILARQLTYREALNRHSKPVSLRKQ